MKILAIGCSFTNYCWPTWADFLDADNYGLSGIGNDRMFYIFNQLYPKLELYDLIVIQWTSPYRFDYKDGKNKSYNGWTVNDGNIAFSESNKDIWKRLSYWYNEEFEKLRTSHFIQATRAMCNAINKPNYHINMSGDINEFCDQELSLMQKYKGTYKFKKVLSDRKNHHKDKMGEYTDEHPTIDSHSNIAKLISKKFNVNPINEQCRLEFLKLHNDITAGKYPDLRDVDDKWREMRHKMEKEGIKKAYPDIFQL